MSRYTTLGNFPKVPAAELTNLVSRANLKGDTRLNTAAGAGSLGKVGGLIVIRDNGGTDQRLVMALGAKSSDPWVVVDGLTVYTPVNISTWTPSAGCTYSAGVLTADGVDNPTATQVVALKKGKYRVDGLVNRHAAGDVPALKITGATDGVLLNKQYQFAIISADDSVKDILGETFTITADQNVTFDISIVNAAGSLEAGAAYISLLLEGLNA